MAARYETLKDKFLVPPGGWVYKDVHTGAKIEGGSKHGLIRMVMDYRKEKGLPCGYDLSFQIEHQICRKLPPKYVKNRRTAVTEQILTMHEVGIKTQKLLTDWTKGGRALVEIGKVKERSEICQVCKMNTRVGCLSCRGVDKHLFSWLGESRRTGYEEALHVCKIGRCYIMAMVHMELRDVPDAIGVTDECWRRTETYEHKH